MKRLFIFALLLAVLAFIPISTGTVTAQPVKKSSTTQQQYLPYKNWKGPQPQSHVQHPKPQPAVHHPVHTPHRPSPAPQVHHTNSYHPRPSTTPQTHRPIPSSAPQNHRSNLYNPRPSGPQNHHNNIYNPRLSPAVQNHHHNPHSPRPSPGPQIHHLNTPRPDIHHMNGPRPDFHHSNGPRPDVHHLNGPRPDIHHPHDSKPDAHNPKHDNHHPKPDDHNKPKADKPQSNAGPSSSGPSSQNNNQPGPQNNNQPGPQSQADNQTPQNQPQDSANGSPCKVPATRQGIVAAAMWAASSGKYISYSQGGSRWSGITKKTCPYQGVPQVTDCSAFVTWLYWSAFGNGNDFVNGQGWKAGYTGTMGSHGTPVSLAQARPGDIVLYGSGTYDHATLYVGNNKVVSFGANGPAKLLNINYRSNYHIRSYLP